MGRKISGTILAGGVASRLDGRIKPKIIIDGESIIARIMSVIREIFDEIIIVTNSPEEFSDFSFCKLVQDEIPGAGPLGGIHAAMKVSSNDSIFVFAGDMPFLDKEIILSQIEAYTSAGCDVLIPEIEERIEPLHSIFRISLAENIAAYLNGHQGNAVRDFIKLLNVQYLQFEGSEKNRKAFTNINSHRDIT